jgi:cytoskeletal protein CcmA (bactofilin family)
MAKNNDMKGIEHITTALGKETNFSGTMRFKDSLKINGKFKGNIISDGFLYIAEGAIVNADICVGSVVIGGIVRGNVEAKKKLEILSTAQLFGNIKTAKLKIEDGVVFDGKCEMIKNADSIEIFSNNTQEIKKLAKSVF